MKAYVRSCGQNPKQSAQSVDETGTSLTCHKKHRHRRQIRDRCENNTLSGKAKSAKILSATMRCDRSDAEAPPYSLGLCVSRGRLRS